MAEFGTIDYYQERWWEEQAKIESGNLTAAEAERAKEIQSKLHDRAEAIRSNYGFSGGDDGSQIIVTDEAKYTRSFSGSESKNIVAAVEAYGGSQGSSGGSGQNSVDEPQPGPQGTTEYSSNGSASSNGLGPGVILAGLLMLVFLLRR